MPGAVNNPNGQDPAEISQLRLSAKDKKILESIRLARSLYPFPDINADDTVCVLEDVFGPDMGDRNVYEGPLIPRWLSLFDEENRAAARAHEARLEREFGTYTWNLLGWLARAVTITEKWVGKYPPVPMKKGK